MKSILIVEDDDTYRRSLEQILTKSGFTTTSAANGRIALDLYHPERFDAVVLDLIMPDIEGIETLTKLRRMSPNVKVIVISGGGKIDAKDYLALALKLGAVEVLAKPFSAEELLNTMRGILGT